MELIQTDIDGVVIIEPRLFKDERGYFFESFSQRDFNKQIRTVHFVQDNESKSSYGVLRGLHFQKQGSALRVHYNCPPVVLGTGLQCSTVL